MARWRVPAGRGGGRGRGWGWGLPAAAWDTCRGRTVAASFMFFPLQCVYGAPRPWPGTPCTAGPAARIHTMNKGYHVPLEHLGHSRNSVACGHLHADSEADGVYVCLCVHSLTSLPKEQVKLSSHESVGLEVSSLGYSLSRVADHLQAGLRP